MRKALILFTRVPIAGKTKTRLMPFLTAEQCAELHKAFLKDIIAVCRNVDADLFICATPSDKVSSLADILKLNISDICCFPQKGENLGQRMHNALSYVLSLGYDACLLFGSDLPELSCDILNKGFNALVDADVTLGPTPDGGYWLVGLKKSCPELFENQQYGSGNVYENAIKAITKAGRSFSAAPTLNDVDTPDDLRELNTRIKSSNSHTAIYLEGIFNA